MRNVLTEADTIDANARIESLDNDDEILGTLPNYLKMEVAIYARAEMIHRREKLFLHCSNVFLVALSSALPRTRTLISGDYLMKENEPFDVALRRFKRSCEKAGILAEVRRREFYEKPTSVRKRKAAAAVKRHLKKVQRESRKTQRLY